MKKRRRGLGASASVHAGTADLHYREAADSANATVKFVRDGDCHHALRSYRSAQRYMGAASAHFHQGEGQGDVRRRDVAHAALDDADRAFRKGCVVQFGPVKAPVRAGGG